MERRQEKSGLLTPLPEETAGEFGAQFAPFVLHGDVDEILWTGTALEDTALARGHRSLADVGTADMRVRAWDTDRSLVSGNWLCCSSVWLQ